MPHHTDTSVILYNKEMLDSAGITSVPTKLEDAWTWEEFDEVAATLRESLPASKYPFAYNWQGNGVTRWLSWLFQADGRFLTEDLMASAIDSDAGRAAVEFTQSFFTKKYVPANDSVKSTTYASDIWYSETAAMTWAGAFLLPDAASTLTFEWGATYAPVNARGGSDFGGNALVATAGTKQPELAAAFWSSRASPAAASANCGTLTPHQPADIPTVVAPSATTVRMSQVITQRELRNGSGDIMRRLDHGESFVVTRHGVPVGELTPLRRLRFVTAESATAMFRGAPSIDRARFLQDLDAVVDQRTEPRG